jgi:hypothetical protein
MHGNRRRVARVLIGMPAVLYSYVFSVDITADIAYRFRC